MVVKKSALEAKAVAAVSRCGYPEPPAIYLEISNRNAEDTAYYPDPDVDLIASPLPARGKMTHKDDTPY
jgi:hypothetical protein